MSESGGIIELPRIIRHVAFTCDFLRFSFSENGVTSFQPRNMAWLKSILTVSRPWRDSSVIVESVAPPLAPELFYKSLDNSAAASEYQADPELAWATRYDQLSLDAFSHLVDALCGYDLVVGFEMSPTVRRLLHARGRGYINFYVHPLRFLRDLCLGATTNVSSVASALNRHQVPSQDVEEQVGRFRGLFLRSRLSSCAIPEGVPVVAGQTEKDSVLIANGRFADWSDFEQALDECLSDFPEVLFSEHPSRPSSARVIEYLRTRHGKTVISTNVNSYGVLFSNSQIPKVVTLASSLGVEASALQIPTEFLLADPRQKFLIADIEAASTPLLGHGALTAAFWGEILNQEIDGEQSTPWALGDNFLRASLDAWSYPPLVNGLAGVNGRKSLLPSGTLTVDREEQLLAALTDFEPLSTLSVTKSLERAARMGVDLQVLESPLRIGERRRFRLGGGGPKTCVGPGFHPPESWGVWSCDLYAELVLSIAKEAVERGARLSISLPISVYEGLLPHCPVLRVSADGVCAGYAMFRPGTNWQTLEFAVDVSASLLRIGLELSELESPALTLDSADIRWLGVRMVEFDVECVAARRATTDQRSESDEPLLWGIGADVCRLTPALLVDGATP